MQFKELRLTEPLIRAVRTQGYTEPSPIQEQAIPYVLEGRDLLGCAQTGTGKTAAFALPILQRLSENNNTNQRVPRVLVLSPTRELAAQIGDSFETYGQFLNLRQITIFGGVNQRPQVSKLNRGAEIIVATPGRLLDLMNQGFVKLDRIEILVLDEADRMLDMGFIHDVKRIIAKAPARRQTLLFSATMPNDIQSLADNILNNPVRVEVAPQSSTVDTIDQSIYFVEKSDKINLLEHLLADRSMKRVLVFTRTKHGANKVVKKLDRSRIRAEAIHGNKSQAARERALANFKSGSVRVLVATDIAARGIDVDDITHVINFDLPNESESYVHRIGRTGRAGAPGIAYAFCDTDERAYLVDIERLIQMHITRADEYPYMSPRGLPPVTDLSPRRNGNGRRSGSGQQNSRNNRNNRNHRRPSRGNSQNSQSRQRSNRSA